MDGNVAFEILKGRSVAATASLYQVGGRAYEDVHIRDVLYLVTPVQGTAALLPGFEVVALEAYGASLQVLPQGVSGTLTLRGGHFETLQPGATLRRASP